MSTRHDQAAQIVAWEARRDSAGKLRVYTLPPNDGGGRYEIAGINERYDPTMAAQLKALIEAGRQDEAEQQAIDYIATKTDRAASWSALPAIQFFLRDTAFNRGDGGAAKILQVAVKTDVDGAIGPQTRAAVTFYEQRPILFLARLRVARESYEREHVGYRANFWAGLVNRWDNALAAAIDIGLA